MSHRVDVFFCAVDAGGGGMVDTSSTATILRGHVTDVSGSRKGTIVVVYRGRSRWYVWQGCVWGFLRVI